jgi:hypothetical protein
MNPYENKGNIRTFSKDVNKLELVWHQDAEDRDTLWHHHNHNTETTTVSGVYYMHLPIAGEVVGPQTAGTELAPNGPEGDGKYFTPWREGHWMIYPGKIWHRPGILHTEEDRYIVAADMEF